MIQEHKIKSAFCIFKTGFYVRNGTVHHGSICTDSKHYVLHLPALCHVPDPGLLITDCLHLCLIVILPLLHCCFVSLLLQSVVCILHSLLILILVFIALQYSDLVHCPCYLVFWPQCVLIHTLIYLSGYMIMFWILSAWNTLIKS